MKSLFSSFFTAALMLSAVQPLLANDIVVYKGVYTEKATWFTERSQGTAQAVGDPASSGTSSRTFYLAIDLTTKELIRVDYYRFGTSKGFSIDDADSEATTPDSNPYTTTPLIEYYDVTQPVKGKVPSFLWSGVSAFAFKDTSEFEDDDDSLPDFVFSTDHGLMTGVGVPFALGNGSFIQNVAPKVSGTWFTSYGSFISGPGSYVDENTGDTVPYPSSQFFQSGRATETITLDAVLTKAANLTPVPATIDLGLGAGPHPAATMNNAIQRIRDALVKQGYQFVPPA